MQSNDMVDITSEKIKKDISKSTGLNHIIDITPDKSLIKKLGLTGYRTEQAVAELIDNSIDARIKEKIEHVSIVLDFEKRKITISDDGQGMNREELKDALIIAKETKKDGENLGQFGLGMKSACSNLGKSFTIITSKPNSKREFTACYDEDQWLGDESKNWSNFEIKEAVKKRNWYGTIIIISKLKIPLYPNQLSNFRKRFGIRYGPHLKNRQIRIKINSKDCKVVKPDLKKGTMQKFTIALPSGNRMDGWIGLLEKRSIKGDFGIHLYRKGRLIKAFDKFGIRHHPSHAKIIGQVSLDHIPVNFHKTGFLEDSLEYTEAVDMFKKDPTVINVLRSASAQKVDISEIKSVFEHESGTILKNPINTRLSDANAKSLLRKANDFTIQKGPLKLRLEFEDDAEGIYQIDSSNDMTKIMVNRTSDSFMAFKNPLFLLGLIRIEAEMIADDPTKYATFVRERNKRWSEFVSESLLNQNMKDRSEKIVPMPNYSLKNELIELHDYLKENYGQNFQFTGLGTLSPFLHNAYSKIIYNIQTINGAGQYLLEAITDYTEKFTVLLNPKPLEVETILKATKENKIIIIREYAENLTSTWATPEKAWLDLYVEVKKYKITMYADELIAILGELFRHNLTNLKKLQSLSKHRKLLDSVTKYLENK